MTTRSSPCSRCSQVASTSFSGTARVVMAKVPLLSSLASSSDPPIVADATQDIIDVLVQTSFEVAAIVTRVGAEHDLSLTLVRMLGILRDRTLTMAELADYLGLERSTVSGLVDRAERRELVVRQASTVDGRSIELRLSATGHALADGAVGVVSERLAPIIESLPRQARQALELVLDGLHASRR